METEVEMRRMPHQKKPKQRKKWDTNKKKTAEIPKSTAKKEMAKPRVNNFTPYNRDQNEKDCADILKKLKENKSAKNLQATLQPKIKSPRINFKEEDKINKNRAIPVKNQAVKADTGAKPKNVFNADVDLMKRLKSKPIVPKTGKGTAQDELVVAFLKKTLEDDSFEEKIEMKK